jgi:ribosomal protein L44E
MKKSSKKVPIIYRCETCDYNTSRKSQWSRHILTAKHLKFTNDDDVFTEKVHKEFRCENCNKIFNFRQSLWRHKKQCKKIKNNHVGSLNVSKCFQNVSNKYICECGRKYKSRSGLYKHSLKCTILEDVEENKPITEIVPTNNVEKLLKNILEENKILREKITNMEMGNTYNNTQNNNFNINMFLNEKCKNAMNLEDFVEKIKLSLEDLQFTKDNGYAKGISNIFIKNLNDMDVTERPIHCSDQKRLQFYVKNDNEWTKDNNNEKIDSSIEKISKKQLKSIQDWVEANPDYLESDVKTEEYFTLVRSITQPNDDRNLKNIKRKVGENVKIDK